MEVQETPIDGVVIITPDVHEDDRGFFLETFQVERYADAGLTLPFLQDNHSCSRPNVLRGLHYQIARPQGHLVSVLRGAIFDVGVDLRPGSPSFGRWYGLHLRADSFRQLYLPPGVAHGLCVIGSEIAEVQYKCTDIYDREDEAGLLWSDPDVGVEWPIATPQISARDAALPRLADIPVDRLPTMRNCGSRTGAN